MSGLFSKPKMPAPTSISYPVSPVAQPTTVPEIEAVKEEEKTKLKVPKKRKTILTSPRGILEGAMVQRKTLLGE